MSHFTTIKTKISDVEVLIKTLDSMKLNWYKKKLDNNNFLPQKEFCNIKIKQQNGYDIEFSKKLDFYELVYDEMFWQQNISSLNFKNNISYNYSLNIITRNLSKKGYIINNINKEEEKNYTKAKVKLNALRFR